MTHKQANDELRGKHQFNEELRRIVFGVATYGVRAEATSAIDPKDAIEQLSSLIHSYANQARVASEKEFLDDLNKVKKGYFDVDHLIEATEHGIAELEGEA